MIKKVLIVTYYWPPSSGVGVKRWYFFSQELLKLGVEVVVLTPSNPQFTVKDFEAEESIPHEIDVLKIPIWEPFALMQKLTGGKNKSQVKQGLVLEKEKQGFLDKLLIWIRGNFFIPDARRFWVKPASKFILEYLKNHPVDVLITTGPPHSMHLIGRGVKQKSTIFWVADFRDPWSNWDLLEKLKTSRFAKWLHRRYEKKVLQNADLVLATSPRQAADLKKFGAKHTFSVTNGFSKNVEKIPPQQFDKFRITHLGLLNELRNPVEFWEVLNEIAQENAAFAEVLEVALYGIVGDSVREEFKKWPALASNVLVKEYLNQNQLKAKMADASVLLVVQNRSQNATRIIPYKLFEYLPMQRPILQLGAGFGDSNDILNAFDFCRALDVSDKKAMKDAIQILFKNWQNKIEVPANSDLEKYTHPYLAKKLLAEISRLKNE